MSSEDVDIERAVHEVTRREFETALDAERARAEKAERERDEAQAALVELRSCVLPCSICRGSGIYAKSCTLCGDSTYDHDCNTEIRPCPAPACGDLRRALAAAPAALAGQVRARVLRELAAEIDGHVPAHWYTAADLRALANEAERGGGG